MSQIATDIASCDISDLDIENSTVSKISYRILPFLVISYVICFLDRVNVSFAALTMNADLSLSPTVYAWGAGIFFLGYFLFEIPSNLALHRFGASRWIARIMISWGLISAAMALVSGPYSFYFLRFILGVAEAGFFPGIILYLTYWYPAKYRARVLSGFILGVPLSAVIGGPVSGYLLEMNGVLGLKGWQWLFLLEGLPAVILGMMAFFYLTDSPLKATWLTEEQKQWLAAKLDHENAAKQEIHSIPGKQVLGSPKIWALGLTYFGVLAGLYGVQFWIPQIVKAFGLTNVQTGFVSALPFAFGTLSMFLWGRRSDRKRERVKHIAIPLFLTAIALVASGYAGNLVLTMVALIFAGIGGFAAFGLFWTLPTALLSGTAAAAGIALINSVGSLSGFGGPYLMGWVKEYTGSANTGLLVLAVFPLIAGALVLMLGHDSKTEFAADSSVK